MVYRELIFEKSNNIDDNNIKENKLIEGLHEFLNITEKKEYNIHLGELCCSQIKSYEKTNNWAESKGFFCSSLVAASFMATGVMKSINTAGKYLPGNTIIINEN